MSIDQQSSDVKSIDNQIRIVKVVSDTVVTILGNKVVIKGPLGTLEKDFLHIPVKIELNDGNILISTPLKGRRAKSILGTVSKHIVNMMKGVKTKYLVKMIAVHSHFPMTLKVIDGKVLVENYVGERYPRAIKLPSGVEAKVNGENIDLISMDIDKVTQVAGLVEKLTATAKKDSRVFLDGVYILSKGYENELTK